MSKINYFRYSRYLTYSNLCQYSLVVKNAVFIFTLILVPIFVVCKIVGNLARR